MPAHLVYRRFGSVRILRDGRVRFSARCYPGLPHLGFLGRGNAIDVERSGWPVIFITLDRQRILAVCFAFDLAPDALRQLVSEMRQAGSGLERWIVPALEYTSAGGTLKRNNPDLYAIIPEILASCRDLPVAEGWQEIRANVFLNAAKAEADRAREEQVALGKTSKKGSRARKSGKVTPSKAGSDPDRTRNSGRDPRNRLKRP